MYLLICKKNDIRAYIICIYSVSPLSLGYRNQLIQSVSRPDGGLLHPGTTTTHPWLSAETMSPRWQIPVKTSLMAQQRSSAKTTRTRQALHTLFTSFTYWNDFSSSRRSWMKYSELYQSPICLVMQPGINHTTFIRLVRTGFLTEPGLVWVWVLCHCCLLSCLVEDS